MKISAREIALISVFSALQIIVSRLPGIPIFGLPNSKIEPQIILMSAIGIILGPWVGGLTAFIGNFIAWLIPTTTFFGMLMLPTVPIGAIVCGALSRGNSRSNWKIAAVILALLNCLWYLSPPGPLVPYYPIPHLLALALVLAFRNRIYGYIKSESKRRIGAGVVIASFSGLMANHMVGNLIFIASAHWFIQLKGIKDAIASIGFFWLTSGLPKVDPTGLGTTFAVFFPISIIERTILTAISSIICVGILYTLRRSNLIRL
ncbi:MAG: ECF transporter S component [Candidatus Bathyarchaeia archaeon]|nr:ECF transporter S component [Candidatus Bathyarchaeota archaeon]